jgi:sulfite exporter TauE/SafE
MSLWKITGLWLGIFVLAIGTAVAGALTPQRDMANVLHIITWVMMWLAGLGIASVIVVLVASERHRRIAARRSKWLDSFKLPDDDPFPVVCSNGCPEGYLGHHKFSCEEARR